MAEIGILKQPFADKNCFLLADDKTILFLRAVG